MKKEKLTYLESVHRDGRIWGIAVACVLFLFPVSLSLIFGTLPDFGVLLKGVFATAPMYWAVGIVEIFTYVPMLGAGGTYLSFVTGNISNLKLPCAIDAMERAGVSEKIEFSGFEDVSAGIVDWPMSVIRLRSKNPARLSALSSKILGAWRKNS